MDKETFDEYWPPDREGHNFADPDAIEDLKTPTQSTSWKTIIGWIIGAVVTYYFLDSEDPKVRNGVLIFGIGLVYNKAFELMQEIKKLRREVEYLKGSVRENRFIEQNRHNRY